MLAVVAAGPYVIVVSGALEVDDRPLVDRRDRVEHRLDRLAVGSSIDRAEGVHLEGVRAGRQARVRRAARCRAAASAPSSEHKKVTSGSLAVKTKVALMALGLEVRPGGDGRDRRRGVADRPLPLRPVQLGAAGRAGGEDGEEVLAGRQAGVGHRRGAGPVARRPASTRRSSRARPPGR